MKKDMGMSDKLCVVTGANAGIGKETALGLAKMGAHVVMICRSEERGTAAQRDIIQQSGNDKIDLLLADLSLQTEVRRVAAEFNAQYDRLDVLVNNAGAVFMSYQETTEGIEKTFALNHLGYFLLTDLLLEKLKSSAPARVVNVSSMAHTSGKINFGNPSLTGEYGTMKAYSQSKLANVLFTHTLAQRLAGTGVTANSLHPGFVASNFGKNNGVLSKIMMKVLHLLAIPEKKGAETPLYLATSPEVEGVTGKYFDNRKAKMPSALAQDDTAAERLWALSEEMTR